MSHEGHLTLIMGGFPCIFPSFKKTQFHQASFLKGDLEISRKLPLDSSKPRTYLKFKETILEVIFVQ